MNIIERKSEIWFLGVWEGWGKEVLMKRKQYVNIP